MREKKIMGISPFKEAGYANDLFTILFWNCSAFIEDHYFIHYPVVLLGGWKDDILSDDECHIQRITTEIPPPLDIAKISLSCNYPFQGKLPLSLRGFIRDNAEFEKYPYIGNMVLKEWSIEYPKSESRILTTTNKRLERFDLISALWFPDGRIFSFNEELAEQIIKLAKSTVISVHSGHARWECLTEKKEHQKMMESITS